jgi:succinyl-diaminopimelate desuccinylase
VDPFSAKIIDNRMYGRGTADTKGSLAAMMAATAAVSEADIDLQGDLKLVAWAGDEYKPPDAKYFDGMSYLAMNDLIKGDIAIFGEPYDLKITYISRGRIWFEFEVGGVASHSASGAGINAILNAMKLIESIYQIKLGEHPVTGKDTINIGTIKGGTQPNMVPDKCHFTFDIRFGPPLTTDDIRLMVEEKVERLKKADPNFILRSMEVTEKREPFGFNRDSTLNICMKKAGQFLGRELEYGGAVSFGPIADWKDRVGIKEGCLFGPGKTEQAHAINEHIEIDDLIIATKVLALTIPYVCKTEKR